MGDDMIHLMDNEVLNTIHFMEYDVIHLVDNEALDTIHLMGNVAMRFKSLDRRIPHIARAYIGGHLNPIMMCNDIFSFCRLKFGERPKSYM